MKIPVYQVDAFTNRAFSGNPAAVCVLPEQKDEQWMQNVAKEMNLSETAFLLRQGEDYSLRWFTPTVEEELCGHATLASAHVLFETGCLKSGETAKFHTRSGLLTAKLDGNWIELNFPSEPDKETTAPAEILDALKVEPKYVGKNRLDYIVEVESEEIVVGLKPDFDLLAKLNTRGFIVTSAAKNKEYDFVSRFFAPHDGILEDPVTGSAHCCLGPFWQRRTGKSEFTAYQASERGGILKVKVDAGRVYLKGQAITVFKGEMLV